MQRSTLRVRSLSHALAASAVLAAAPGWSYTAEISFEASHFVARSGWQDTGEVPPQGEVRGSFAVSTDAPRDVPDSTGVQGEGEAALPVLNTYTAPLAADLSIAGKTYTPEDLQVHMGFVAGRLELILVSAVAERPRPELPAHIATSGTDDFMLVVQFPTAEGETPPRFTYTVAAAEPPVDSPIDASTDPTIDPPLEGEEPEELGPGAFVAESVRVTVASDEGPPQEFVAEPPVLVDDGALCFAAKPVPGEPPRLDGDVAPGATLCATSAAGAARSAGGGHLREARLRGASSARAAAGVPGEATLTTAFGASALRLGGGDRVLLGASRGDSAGVEPPVSSEPARRCVRVRRAAGAARFDPLRDVRVAGRPSDAYHVRRPSRVCLAADAPAPGDLLCYAARAKGEAPAASDVWVAHAHGVERLRVTRAKEICLPISP